MQSGIVPLLVAIALAGGLAAEDRIELTGGGIIYGSVVGEEPLVYVVLLTDGQKIRLEKATVRRIVALREAGATDVEPPVRLRSEGLGGLGVGSAGGRTYWEVGTQAASLHTRTSASFTFTDQVEGYVLAGSAYTLTGAADDDTDQALYVGRYVYGAPTRTGWRTRWDVRLMYESLNESLVSDGGIGYVDPADPTLLVDAVGEWHVSRYQVTGHQIDINGLMGVGRTSIDGSWAVDGLLGLGVSFAWYDSSLDGEFYDPVLASRLEFRGAGGGEYFGFFANAEVRGSYFFGPGQRFVAAAFLGGKFSHESIDDAVYDPANAAAEFHLIASIRDIGYYTGVSLGASF